jgi:hypothetical protein
MLITNQEYEIYESEETRTDYKHCRNYIKLCSYLLLSAFTYTFAILNIQHSYYVNSTDPSYQCHSHITVMYVNGIINLVYITSASILLITWYFPKVFVKTFNLFLLIFMFCTVIAFTVGFTYWIENVEQAETCSDITLTDYYALTILLSPALRVLINLNIGVIVTIKLR